MSSPKPYYLFRSRTEAELRFYEGYDPDFLFRKADLLHLAYCERDRLTTVLKPIGTETSVLDDAYFHGIAAELHCAALQQFESLFALLLASVQDLPHWIYLTRYRTRDIKERATKLVAGDIAAVSDGRCLKTEDFLATAVYPGVAPPLNSESDPSWRASLRDLSWFLCQMAERYLSSPEYNAYKHGLRVLPGPAQLLVDVSAGARDFRPVLTMKHALTFLDIKEEAEGFVVQEVTKEIDVEDSFQSIYIMASIAETVQKVRVAGLKREPVAVPLFKLNQSLLTQLRPVGRFAFPY